MCCAGQGHAASQRCSGDTAMWPRPVLSPLWEQEQRLQPVGSLWVLKAVWHRALTAAEMAGEHWHRTWLCPTDFGGCRWRQAVLGQSFLPAPNNKFCPTAAASKMEISMPDVVEGVEVRQKAFCCLLLWVCIGGVWGTVRAGDTLLLEFKMQAILRALGL